MQKSYLLVRGKRGAGHPGTGEPIWVTTYGYDTLGNLTSVLQNGSHQRSFVYDSLSRLLTSTNPEVGQISYAYNSDSVLISKTDARGITTNYSPSDSPIDVLHRVTKVTYSNSDPSLTFAYDQTNFLGLSSCQNIGHRTSMTDAGGSEAWSYHVDNTNTDTTKRNVHVNSRTTGGISKPSTYYLDQAGNLAHITYPTSRVVNYTFDNADRPSTATDGSNGITYASGFDTSPAGTCVPDVTCYTPQGTFYALALGETASFTGLNLTHIYNNRLQPQEFKASSSGGNAIDITYNFVDPSTGKNAGVVYGITNNLDTTRSLTFTYDQLNRLTAALTTSTYSTSPSHCWGEAYALDAWGNLNTIARTTNSAYTGCSQESGFSTTADANNHLPLFGYDSSGNAQSDGSISYTWNGESQLKSATNAGLTTNYLYDGDGRRVSKVGSKLYWYGSGDDILAETDASGNTTAEYIFFGGKRIAMIPSSGSPPVAGNPTYYVEDMLGTSRVLTTNPGVVCYDADFYPFGGERSYTNTCPQNYKFEGKERDTETGNDDFGARYYSNRFGRWLSADWSSVPVPVPYANLTNPQTLNLYAMVADNPESFADLDGHDAFPGATPDPSGLPGCGPRPILCDDKKKDPPPAPDAPVNKVKDIPYIGGTLNWLVDGDKIAQASKDLREAETTQGKIGEGAALVLIILVDIAPGAGKAGKAAAKGEEVVVYEIAEHGETVYVGITNSLKRRATEWGAELTPVLNRTFTRKEARAIEQAVIEHFGLGPKGGRLRNLINSISPTRHPEAYKEAVAWGRSVLESEGYHF